MHNSGWATCTPGVSGWRRTSWKPPPGHARPPNKDFPKAQLYLGHMYHMGEGVPQDYVQAYTWFILAAAQGEERAFKLKDELD